ncbi:hypothetical protein [Oceanirhabdus sp. W0125-5]|uniref:hypothetical protein n=1 Tax=Oceanirhabdus sp. W0125-5 TaxID=2999116 RepID=UPI0022F2EF24|nr:hypothetical protein [Oceanirhabdus sp. W0125-5]WBW95941.1 hypothetical protein OW730_19945 [Oceanirhabdus sp. W0125-5]
MMIRISKVEDVEKIGLESLRNEIDSYIREIVGEEELSEVGEIIVIEDTDSSDVLVDLNIADIEPEFVDKVKLDNMIYFRITLICGDSFGYIIYSSAEEIKNIFARYLKERGE